MALCVPADFNFTIVIYSLKLIEMLDKSLVYYYNLVTSAQIMMSATRNDV